MDIPRWEAQLLQAVLEKLDAEREILERCDVHRLDIGVFPWFGFIELSVQSIDEMDLTNHVADWRLYNFAGAQEGKWPESERLGKEMLAHWTVDPAVAEAFFEATGAVAKSSDLRRRLLEFFSGSSVEVTVLNPDNRRSRNYAA